MEKELEPTLLKQQLADIENDPNTQTLAARQEELVKDRTAWVADMVAWEKSLDHQFAFAHEEELKECLAEMTTKLERFGPIHWREVALKAEFKALGDARAKVEVCERKLESMKQELKDLTGGCGLSLRKSRS